MKKRLRRKYWYYHGLSDSVYWSYNRPKVELKKRGGAVEEIDRKRARFIVKEIAWNLDHDFDKKWELILNKYNGKSKA